MKNILTFFAIIFLFSCSSSGMRKVKIFPTYGNYCGINNPRAFSRLDPINIVDFLCEERLDCYKRNGRKRRKACDKLFVKELLKATPRSVDETNVRQSIISYFEK